MVISPNAISVTQRANTCGNGRGTSGGASVIEPFQSHSRSNAGVRGPLASGCAADNPFAPACGEPASSAGHPLEQFFHFRDVTIARVLLRSLLPVAGSHRAQIVGCERFANG